jgi:transcription termination factor Rho
VSSVSVLDRDLLEQSPLADLHAIASELSIDGYRRLRKSKLIDAILARQSGEPIATDDVDDEAVPAPAGIDDDEQPSGRRRRGRRGGRGRSSSVTVETPATGASTADEEEHAAAVEDEETVEGVVELLSNGSGFVRVNPPDPSDDDVYISAAQVKRCELVTGDQVAGPRRAPRRSERFASLIRIDTINGQPAAELVSGMRFDDLPAAFPNDRLQLDSEDATIKAIESLTPFGKGSRVTIVGPARAGKTEVLRRLAAVLAQREDLQLSIALAGVRPEEVAEWSAGGTEPAAAVSLAGSADAQDNAVELVIDQARRIAARGADAVVLVDTLDGLHPPAARKVLAAARNIVDGGSLTVIATASSPLGGETTVIALDAALTNTGRFPALDLPASGTTRAELLVGEDGAESIASARREALAG